MRNFREYDIWKSAIKLSKELYLLTGNFPSTGKYGLSSQIQRAVVSIASNIAEGSSRTSEKEFTHFLEIAQGSAFEVETQIIIAQQLGYLNEADLTSFFDELNVLQKQINFLINKLKN